MIMPCAPGVPPPPVGMAYVPHPPAAPHSGPKEGTCYIANVVFVPVVRAGDSQDGREDVGSMPTFGPFAPALGV